MKLERWQWIVIATVVAVIANLFCVRAYLLWTRQENPEAAIFKTYNATGNCFYKKQSETKWFFLSGEENIFEGTNVQTEADGNVILSFVNADGKIEVSQNTELEVEKNRTTTYDETVLDFKKGEVFINYESPSSKSSLVVKVGQKYFRLQNTDLYVFGEANGQVAISVDYGRATMSMGESGDRQGSNVFQNGQMIFFRNDRDYSVEESPFKILTPLNYDRYSVEDEISKVRFAFSPLNKDYYIQLFLGATPFDMKPYFQSAQKMKNNEFSVAFPRGNYYWRLGAASSPRGPIEFYSHTKRFFIEPKIRIQPVFPVASAHYPLRTGKAQVQFEWDNPSQLEKPFIEISDHKDFSHLLVHEATGEKNYYLYNFDHTGEYYWRVSGFPFKSSELINGVIRKIVIADNNPQTYLKILFPRDDITLTTSSFESSDVRFQWTKNPTQQHPHYKVEISSTSSSKKYVFDSDDNFLNVPHLSQGSYRWQVLDAETTLPISEIALFRIIKTRQLHFQTQENSSGLSWEKGPKGTATYHVEVIKIGSKSSLNEIFSKENWSQKKLNTKSEKFNVSNYTSGVYAFKVYALDKEKNILADSSLKFLKISEKK